MQLFVWTKYQRGCLNSNSLEKLKTILATASIVFQLVTHSCTKHITEIHREKMNCLDTQFDISIYEYFFFFKMHRGKSQNLCLLMVPAFFLLHRLKGNYLVAVDHQVCQFGHCTELGTLDKLILFSHSRFDECIKNPIFAAQNGPVV